jgi:hypothetical protein
MGKPSLRYTPGAPIFTEIDRGIVGFRKAGIRAKHVNLVLGTDAVARYVDATGYPAALVIKDWPHLGSYKGMTVIGVHSDKVGIAFELIPPDDSSA